MTLPVDKSALRAPENPKPVRGGLRHLIVQRVRIHLRVLRGGTPGTRFREFRKYQKEHDGPHIKSRLATFLTGLVLVGIGLAIGWLPGPGGFLAIIGVALLAREIPGIAWALDECEVLGRRLIRWYVSLSVVPRFAITLAACSLVAGSIWVGWSWMF
jgi:hypothetical protein